MKQKNLKVISGITVLQDGEDVKNQWIDKVNPDDNRDAYRLKALEFALELNPNVEFEIGMKLEKYYNFVVDTL